MTTAQVVRASRGLECERHHTPQGLPRATHLRSTAQRPTPRPGDALCAQQADRQALRLNNIASRTLEARIPSDCNAIGPTSQT